MTNPSDLPLEASAGRYVRYAHVVPTRDGQFAIFNHILGDYLCTVSAEELPAKVAEICAAKSLAYRERKLERPSLNTNPSSGVGDPDKLGL